MNSKSFIDSLSEKPLSDIVQEIVLEGIPFCFAQSPDVYKLLRHEVCEKFGIHPQNFAVVGSAKLGFSVAPDKYGKPFSDESDIDIVLVSEELFQSLWLDLLKYAKTTVYKLNYETRREFRDFQTFLFDGRIRLDKIPGDYPFAKEWWEFFNKLSTDRRFGQRHISAIIFKSWQHVSIYYEDGLRKVKEQHESHRV